MNKIFVTGPTGTQGFPIVKELLAKGFQIRAFALESDPKLPQLKELGPNVEVVCGDLLDEESIYRAMDTKGTGEFVPLSFSAKTGKPLNNNLLDYKLSTFMDHPHLEAQFVENAEPTSPFGTKALGEPPACSGAPAIRNAIYNATGVAVDTIPITPHVLFAEFTKAGLIHDSWNEKEGK